MAKINKRLWVCDVDGTYIYTPPDFIRLQSREPLWALARELEHSPYINAVMGFESTHFPACSRRR